jgi:hypothetical protein
MLVWKSNMLFSGKMTITIFSGKISIFWNIAVTFDKGILTRRYLAKKILLLLKNMPFSDETAIGDVLFSGKMTITV